MKNFSTFEFAKINVKSFIDQEKCIFIGQRSGKIVIKNLKDVYEIVSENPDFLTVRNKEKQVAFWLKISGIDKKFSEKTLKIPRYISITPDLISLLAWAEGEFGKSPLRNPQWSSSSHEEHKRIMELFCDIFNYNRNHLYGTVQINKEKFERLSVQELNKILKNHAQKINLPPENLRVIKGTTYQSEIDTINLYYNPILFELVRALTEFIVKTLPKFIREKRSLPTWLICEKKLTEPIAKIDFAKFCSTLGYKIIKDLNNKVQISRPRGKRKVVINRFIEINIESILWCSLMLAEGNKEGDGFISNDLSLVQKVLEDLSLFFDFKSLDPRYDIILGIVYAKEYAKKLSTDLTLDTITRERKSKSALLTKIRVPKCLNQKVIKAVIQDATQECPILNQCRFRKLRIDMAGKGRSKLRLHVWWTHTVSDCVKALINNVIFNLDGFIENFSAN